MIVAQKKKTETSVVQELAGKTLDSWTWGTTPRMDEHLFQQLIFRFLPFPVDIGKYFELLCELHVSLCDDHLLQITASQRLM